MMKRRIRFSFGGFLTSEGHDVVTADGYAEAIEIMDEAKFRMLADIVVDDGWGLTSYRR
jgi:DNA-binding NtrC family response regulator